jgi:hypothetical protein
MSQDVVVPAAPEPGAGGAPAEPAATATVVTVESPPPAPQPARSPDPADEPRARLHQLAERLTRSRPRQLLVEYLQLRRSLM